MGINQYLKMAAGGRGWTAGRAAAGPLYAAIGVSDPCNQRCAMCWDHPPAQRESEGTSNRFAAIPQRIMSLQHFQAVIDDLRCLGTRRVDLVARGEPLLSNAILDMVKYTKRNRMYCHMVSNAARLSEEKARGLVEAGLDRLQVSLNAGRPETYPEIHVTESPESYLKVKQNVTRLTALKRTSGSAAPHVRIGFVISSKNYFELEDMVRISQEMRADEAVFSHTTVHDGTTDLKLTPEQYEELKELLEPARGLAIRMGLSTNLTSFAATPPTYLHEEIRGPSVVPCYAGWYTTFILGNGSVMPCCQCVTSVGVIGDNESFAELWNAQKYQAVREAMRNLPTPSEVLHGCDCGNCTLRPRNVSMHNLLHPWDRIDTGDRNQLFTLSDLLRRRKKDRG